MTTQRRFRLSSTVAIAHKALVYGPALVLIAIGILFADIRFDYGVMHEGVEPSRLSLRYVFKVVVCSIPAAIWLAVVKAIK